jgi:two-component system, LytTR family, sensor kinase
MNIKSFLAKNKAEIKWQLVLFGVYFIIAHVQAYSEHPAEGIYFKEIVGILNVTVSECILVNALGNWLLVKYSFAKQPKLFLFLLGSIITIFTIYRYLTSYPDHVDVFNNYNTNTDKTSLVFFTFISIINFILSYLVALGLYSIKKSIQIEQKARILENKMTQAQLSILKNQINPHFLYNTLSYMYGQARPVSENLSKSILMLSDMMRYSLTKVDDNGLTLLEKEIHYIENFIEIHRLRFDEDFYVNFTVDGLISNKKIVPLLLITFVENAIKHGIINDSEKPININLMVEPAILIFEIENYKQIGTKDESSGIGLENTKKRLELAYQNKHKLIITDEQNQFKVRLEIELT